MDSQGYEEDLIQRLVDDAMRACRIVLRDIKDGIFPHQDNSSRIRLQDGKDVSLSHQDSSGIVIPDSKDSIFLHQCLGKSSSGDQDCGSEEDASGGGNENTNTDSRGKVSESSDEDSGLHAGCFDSYLAAQESRHSTKVTDRCTRSSEVTTGSDSILEYPATERDEEEKKFDVFAICGKGLKREWTLDDDEETSVPDELPKRRRREFGSVVHAPPGNENRENLQGNTNKDEATKKKRKHVCTTCGKEFLRKCRWKDHLVSHTGIYPYTCKICNRGFLRPGKLVSHTNDLHSNKESEGNKITSTMTIQSPELQVEPNMLNEPKEADSGCLSVDDQNTVTSVQEQVDSREMVHGALAQSGTEIRSAECGMVIEEQVPPNDKTRECLEGNSRNDVQVSQQPSHNGDWAEEEEEVGEMEEKYNCPLCGKGFRDKSYLKTHSKVHTREYPFRCLICKKGFQWQSQLFLHTRTQHPEEEVQSNQVSSTMTQVAEARGEHKKVNVLKATEDDLNKLTSIQDQRGSNNMEIDGGPAQQQTEIKRRKHGIMVGQQASENEKGERERAETRMDNQVLQHPTAGKDGKKEKATRAKRKHVCPICGREFLKKCSWKDHLVSHTGIYPHTCKICNRGFMRPGELVSHTKKAHSNKETGGNQFTSTMTIQSPELQVEPYMLNVPKEADDGCLSVDDQNTVTSVQERVDPREIEVHSALAQSGTEIRSAEVGQQATEYEKGEREGAKTRMDNQVLQHPTVGKDGEKEKAMRAKRKHVCPSCGREFLKKRNWHDHIIKHTGKYPHTCTICDKGFPRAGRLVSHLKEVHPNQEMTLPPDLQVEHNVENEPRASDNGSLSVNDHNTGTSVQEQVDSNDIQGHSSNVHGQTNIRSKDCGDIVGQHAPSENENRKSVEGNTNMNNQEHPTENGDVDEERRRMKQKLYHCPVCGKGFPVESYLTTHSKVHTREYPVRCSICNMGFRWQSQLFLHASKCQGKAQRDNQLLKLPPSINGDGKKKKGRRHVCPSCGKEFLKKSNWQDHIIKHTRKYPHTCTICKKGFRSPGQLVFHLKKLHPVDGKEIDNSIHDADSSAHASPQTVTRNDSKAVNTGKQGTSDVSVKHLRDNASAKIDIKLSQSAFKPLENGDRGKEKDSKNKPSHVCPECGKVFRNLWSLKEHVVVHTRVYPFRCGICHKGFTRAMQCSLHVIKQHSRIETETQKEPFPSGTQAPEQQDGHDGQNLQGSSSLMDQCAQHTEKEEGKQEEGQEPKPAHVCPICDKGFPEERNLKEHLVIHTKSSDMRCRICDEQFLQLEQLIMHKETEHSICRTRPETVQSSGGEGECPADQLALLDIPEIKEGLQDKNEVPKPLSTKETDSPIDATLEQKLGPSKVNGHVIDYRVHECHLCGHVFLQKSCLHKHMMDTHQVRDCTVRCIVCDEGFYTRKQLFQHLETSHPTEQPAGQKGRGNKLHVCPKCGKAFTQRDNLKYHILKHMGEYRYKCSVCTRGYMRRSGFNKHMKSMHPMVDMDMIKHPRKMTSEKEHRPFVCETCGESFAEMFGLKRHARVHAGEVNFMCGWCRKGFLRRWELVCHLRKEHSCTQEHKDVMCPKDSETNEMSEGMNDTGDHQSHNDTNSLCEAQIAQEATSEVTDNPTSDPNYLPEAQDTKQATELTSADPNPYGLNNFSDTKDTKERTKGISDEAEKVTKKSPPYICEECDKIFYNEWTYDRHIGDHPGQKVFKCKVCRGSFLQQQELVRHVEKHMAESEISGGTGLLLRIRENNTQTIYKCEVCAEGFLHPEQVFVHMQKHSVRYSLDSDQTETVGILVIDITPKDKSQQCVLTQVHWRRPGVPSKSVRCNRCSGDFNSQGTMHIHRCQPDYHMCSVCGETFSTVIRCGVHMQQHLEKGLFQCPLCDKRFNASIPLEYHMDRWHVDSPKHICDICGKRVWRRDSFLVHMKTHQEKKILERPFRCDKCPKAFVKESGLKKHLPCQGKVKFQCPECGRTFGTMTNLKNHQMVHAGERPFGCNVCSQSFVWKKNLKVHMRLHTGEKPHKCAICQMAFAQHAGLSSHMKRHEKEGHKKVSPKKSRLVS